MKSLDLLGSLFWIVFSLVAIKLATRLSLGGLYEPGPGLFPLLLAFVILGLALVLFFKTIFKAKGEQQRISFKWISSMAKVLPVLTLLLLYAIFLERLGFLIVTFLLILLLLLVVYPQKWWVSLIAALAGSLGSYVIFQVWLHSQLPSGILGF